MIKITNKFIEDALKVHTDKLKIIVDSNLTEYLIEGTQMYNFISTNIENILSQEPENLLKLNTSFINIFKTNTINLNTIIEKDKLPKIIKEKKVREEIEKDYDNFQIVIDEENQNKILNYILNKIFDYSTFTKKNSKKYRAYNLANNLKVTVCPYCNKNYISTVIKENNEGIIRPEFDHYFPQSKYRLLALSFYNLIPCCHECNSNLKGPEDMDLEKYYHPYNDSLIDTLKFEYILQSTKEIEIKCNTESNKAENSNILFKLKERYDAHRDIAKDIIETKRLYSDEYINILQKMLIGTNTNYETVYRLAFGTYLEEDKFINRPFSKFKKDIAKQLNIIK